MELQNKELSIDLGAVLKGKTFDKLKDINKQVIRNINEYREDFFSVLLKRNGIHIDEKMTKREIQDLFEKNKVVVEVNDEAELFYVKGKLVGKWSKKYEYGFSKNGKFGVSIKVEYL